MLCKIQKMADSIATRVKQQQRSNTHAGISPATHDSLLYEQERKNHLRQKAQELSDMIQINGPRQLVKNNHGAVFFLNSAKFPFMDLNNPDTLDEFLRECELLRLFETAFVAAVWAKQGLKAIPVICRGDVSYLRFLCNHLVNNIPHLPSVVHQCQNVDVLVTLLTSFIDSGRLCTLERIQFGSVVRNLTWCDCCIFVTCVFVAITDHYLIHADEVLRKLQRKKLVTFLIGKGFSKSGRAKTDHEVGIHVCLFSFYAKNLSFIRLAYKLGVITPRIFQTLLEDIQHRGFHIDKVDTNELNSPQSHLTVRLIQVEEYIQKAAATPRSLEDQCVTRISQLIGVCDNRPHVMEELEVGQVLTDRLLLKDVCHEFETEASSKLDQARDPPGLFYSQMSVQSALDVLRALHQ